MGIRIGIEIRLTRPKHLSHLTCVSICVWVSVCLSVKSDPPTPSPPATTPRNRQSRSSFKYAAQNDFFFLITQRDRLQPERFDVAIEKFHFPVPHFPHHPSNRMQHVRRNRLPSSSSEKCFYKFNCDSAFFRSGSGARDKSLYYTHIIIYSRSTTNSPFDPR